MDEEKGLININVTKGIMDFLQSPTIKMAKALTGILASDKNELKLSAGRLVQAAIKLKCFKQLGDEIKKYQEKGKIKEDYFATNKEQATLYELLKFIDEEIPDEERFKAMKAIFLISISKDTSEEDEKLAYEFIKICKKITSGGLLIIKSCYDIVNGKNVAEYSPERIKGISGSTEWFSIVSKQIGHNLPSLIEIEEEGLIKLKLISKRMHSDGSGIEKTKWFRLTELGYKSCDFIRKYE